MANACVHADRVVRTVASNSAAAKSRLAASWRRSMVKHGLDPADRVRPTRLTTEELQAIRQKSDQLLHVAAPQIDHLFALVCLSGCAVFLTDASGIVLDERCATGDEDDFKSCGLWSGSDWSERAEGTNGIGTCLAEERRLVIHRDEHFSDRNTAMSCIDAPIHGPDGRLLAALDVSSARVDHSAVMNRLISEAVFEAAKRIETELFRVAFPNTRIVFAKEAPTGTAALLAIDADDVIIGATRAARRAYGFMDETQTLQQPAVDVIGRNEERRGFDRAEYAAVKRALIRAGGNVSAAASALGIGRATLYRRMNRLGLSGATGKLSQD